jgi:RNA polymerase sigma-70 factor (ECF subfamily)
MPKHTNEFVSNLFQLYGHDLFGYLSRRLEHQEVEDVTQKTYLRLLEHPNPGEIQNPHAYLFKTASNLAIDHLRRRRIRVERFASDPETETFSSSDPPPDQAADAARQVQRFREILADLPPVCRSVFLLNRIDGLTHVEIAQRVGISKKSVERHILKALAKFHRRLRLEPE